MRRPVLTAASVVVVLMVMGAAAYALVSQSTPESKKTRANDPIRVAAAGKSVEIQSSKGGSAILIADGMYPGETRGEQVSIKNTGTLPVTLSMGASSITATPANASSIFHTKLFETGKPSTPLYSGPVKDFTSSKVGDISPGESKNFTLQAVLPASVGNEAENIKTSFNIDWNAVEKTTGPPPEECKLRRIRARFFIFKNPRFRPYVRMVSRYQASSGGKVKTTFFWRIKKGKKKFVRGKKIGSMVSKFKKTKGNSWRLNRVWVKKSAKEQRKLFKHPHGFYAKLQPFKTKKYCSNYLNVELTIPKKVDEQQVWFMANSKFAFDPSR